jgi:hypothetical protein
MIVSMANIPSTVVVFGGAGFYFMPKLYKDDKLREQLRDHYPDVDFVGVGTPFDGFRPPHLWKRSERDKTAIQWVCEYWALKARFNEKILAPALRKPLPKGTTRRVALVLFYGFEVRTAATAFCTCNETMGIVAKFHDFNVSVGLPFWNLPIPHYFIPRHREEDQNALCATLAREWKAGPKKQRLYVNHYRCMASTYFKRPQNEPQTIDPSLSRADMRRAVCLNMANILALESKRSRRVA